MRPTRPLILYVPIAALALAVATSAGAQSGALYKCTDDGGHTTYTNQKGAGKSCKVLSTDQPVSTFPAAKPRAAAPTPGDFPRVGNDQQRARDSDRRSILEQELATEQKHLDAARKEQAENENLVMPDERIAGGGVQGAKREARLQGYRDKIQLHERNIEALKKELANIRS